MRLVRVAAEVAAAKLSGVTGLLSVALIVRRCEAVLPGQLHNGLLNVLLEPTWYRRGLRGLHGR